MRNLKRTLSLLLTAAMLIGMMVVGASAASSSDFTDSDEITNIEAAQVMTALGVFEGTDSGAFDPNGTLTREQAAAIICRMLLGEDAEELTTNSVVFSDVSADRWSAGYIGYCAQQGILAGTGNGAFDPEGELTGLAFAKMCLVALGYNADSEGYVGTDWAINVAADAVNAGISPSGLVLANVISREDAAQMAFQTLEADMVTYTGSGSTSVTTPDGSSVVITGAADTIAADQDDDYRGSSDGDEVQQFCEYYFPDLAKREAGEDNFQRPAVTWLDGRTEIGTFSETPDATFTTTAETGELYDAVGRTVYSDLDDGSAGLAVYVDGEEVDTADYDLSDFIARNGDDTAGVRTAGGALISNLRTGNGVLTEVFVDDDYNNVTITMIHTYVAQVEGDYDSTDGELDLDALDGTAMAATDLTVYDEDFDNLDTFSDGDYVLLTVAAGEIQNIALADTVDGDVTAYTEGSSVTVDGTRYYYNRTFEAALETDADALDYDLNEAYTLVLDEYGYVVYSDATEGTSDYVFVSRVAATGGVSDSAEARAYFTDGTYAVIDLDEDSKATYNGDTLIEIVEDSTNSYENINEWYDYDEQSDGSYELNDVSDSGSDTLTGASGGTDIAVSGSAYVYYGDSSSQRFRANSSTVFVINDDGDAETVTASSLARDYDEDDSFTGTVYVFLNDDGEVAEVYVCYDGSTSSGGSTSGGSIVPDDELQLTSLYIKGVEASISGYTASVNMTASQAANNTTVATGTANETGTLSLSLVSSTGTVMNSGDTIAEGTYTLYVTVGSETVTYTVTVTHDDVVDVTVAATGNFTIEDADGDTIGATGSGVEAVMGEAFTFTVEANTGYTVTAISYEVTDAEGTQTASGSFTVSEEGSYTIPAAHMTGDVEITVTTGGAAADVTLALADGAVALLEETGTDAYTLTVPSASAINNGTALAALISASGTAGDLTTPISGSSPNGTEETLTITFTGMNSGASQTISLTIEEADDATKVSGDLALWTAEISSGMNIRLTDASAASALSNLETYFENLVADHWDSTVEATVTWAGAYTPPSSSVSEATINVTITFTSNDEVETYTNSSLTVYISESGV